MKLHLGCGEKFLKGFIHDDIDKKDHINSLEKHLINAGLENIRSYNHVMPLGFDDYSMAIIPFKDPSGIQISLNIEATKR